METLHKAQGRVQTEGIPIINPLASEAAENILGIFDRLSINSKERDFMKIPVVSAYVQGMQASPHDTRNIDFRSLKEQILYGMARELARRQLAGKKP